MSQEKNIRPLYDSKIDQTEVQLLLKSPRFKSHKISQYNLEDVKEFFTTVDSVHLLEKPDSDQQNIVLVFSDCAAIMDFYEEKAGVLTFSSALMRSRDSEMQEFTIQAEEPQTLSIEDFEVRNGQLKLTKKTSLDSLISENDQSTNYISHSDLDAEGEQEECEVEEGMSRLEKLKLASECLFAMIFFCLGVLCFQFLTDCPSGADNHELPSSSDN